MPISGCSYSCVQILPSLGNSFKVLLFGYCFFLYRSWLFTNITLHFTDDFHQYESTVQKKDTMIYIRKNNDTRVTEWDHNVQMWRYLLTRDFQVIMCYHHQYMVTLSCTNVDHVDLTLVHAPSFKTLRRKTCHLYPTTYKCKPTPTRLYTVILFWLLNMTIWCEHVHRLELRKFFNFCAAHLSVRLDWPIETKFLISILDNHVKNKKYRHFVYIIWSY